MLTLTRRRSKDSFVVESFFVACNFKCFFLIYRCRFCLFFLFHLIQFAPKYYGNVLHAVNFVVNIVMQYITFVILIL
jgi:hypothetical protein